MESKWKDDESRDDMAERIYTSRLLGHEEDLVLHGGGNTSLKRNEKDHTGKTLTVLRVKGSGSDLSSIDENGFTGLRMDDLLSASSISSMTDQEMMDFLNKSKINPSEPSPSVESFLHAFIPYRFVDHSHADAILSLTNTDMPEKKIREILGNVFVVPYIPPGFTLARELFKHIDDIKKCEGIVLSKHGLFTFSDSARESYERHINIVTRAERYIKENASGDFTGQYEMKEVSASFIASLRGKLSRRIRKVLLVNRSKEAVKIACSREAQDFCRFGPATPDMLIRTKYDFLYIDDHENMNELIEKYARNYQNEFSSYVKDFPMHDPFPSVIVVRGFGIITAADSIKECKIIMDQAIHSFRVDLVSNQLGKHEFIGKKDAYWMEYWPLEEAKLKKKVRKKFQGYISLVTGAASGIGLETFRKMAENGVSVIACDIDPSLGEICTKMEKETGSPNRSFITDLSDVRSVGNMMDQIPWIFGGIDVVFSNAGILKSQFIEDVDVPTLDLHYSINGRAPFLITQRAMGIMKEQGIGGNLIFNITKNLTHPGPGMLSYGSSKAFAAHVCHYAAKEGGRFGIRANIINPDKIFRNSKIWENGVLEARAKAKGQTVEEYKTQNLLHVEVLPSHVANMVLAMMDDDIFGATTDAMIPVDGGIL